jgi:hypothetical protein
MGTTFQKEDDGIETVLQSAVIPFPSDCLISATFKSAGIFVKNSATTMRFLGLSWFSSQVLFNS